MKENHWGPLFPKLRIFLQGRAADMEGSKLSGIEEVRGMAEYH